MTAPQNEITATIKVGGREVSTAILPCVPRHGEAILLECAVYIIDDVQYVWPNSGDSSIHVYLKCHLGIVSRTLTKGEK
ncbi:hypothetical protein UFOVP1299_33 [uncultured Caudovirales phage]|uniref:Uncharacterized protein n=1 Tax=uncultured Caudovirales phage TaxID=2100421 RepID=A0A6J5RQ46_9CAUD|nr:hypothetical protein UFOVP1299_33 [uncultured Caudovirales phage]